MRKLGHVVSRSGFTLFEVLLALGIFGLAVMGMLGALNSGLSSAREARLGQFVRTQLESRLAILEGEPLRSTQRQVEQASPKITFTESIQKEPITTANHETLDGFWRLKVVANWSTSDGERKEEISFLRYLP